MKHVFDIFMNSELNFLISCLYEIFLNDDATNALGIPSYLPTDLPAAFHFPPI